MEKNRIYVQIYAGDLIYDRLLITPTSVEHHTCSSIKNTTSKPVCFYRIQLTAVTLHCLVKALSECQQCRRVVMHYICTVNGTNRVRIHLLPQLNCADTIDYNWNEKCYFMVRERCELDHALSWLSTLGGAFSALGDYFIACAETAAKISMHQFQLALRIDDPGIAARCRLYFALSLIQRKRFRLARHFIEREYARTKTGEAGQDHRLAKMCQGIWSKLKYDWALHRQAHKSQPQQNVTIKT